MGDRRSPERPSSLRVLGISHFTNGPENSLYGVLRYGPFDIAGHLSMHAPGAVVLAMCLVLVAGIVLASVFSATETLHPISGSFHVPLATDRQTDAIPDSPSAHAHLADEVVQNITVGTDPVAIAVDTIDDHIYVANRNSDDLSVINGTTNRVVATIALGGEPNSLVFDPEAGNLYVSVGSYVSPPFNITIVNTTNGSVTGSIPTSTGPDYLAYDANNGLVYAVNSEDSVVSVIDGANNTVIASIGTGGEDPDSIAFDSANGCLYIANTDSSNLTVINGTTNTVVAYVPPLFNEVLAWSLAVDTQTGFVYVPGGLIYPRSAGITVINDTDNQVTGLIAWTATFNPVAIAYDGSNGYLYVPGVENLTAFNAAAGVFAGTVPTGSNASFLLFDPVNRMLYAADPKTNTIEAINGTASFVPEIVSISDSAPSIDVGQAFNISVEAVGGKGPLEYAYAGLPTGCSSANESQIECAPIVPGAYDVAAFVNDSSGQSATAAVSGWVYARLSVTPTATNRTIVLGQEVEFAVNASGGVPPYSYSFSALPPGCVSQNVSAFACIPSQTGFYNVTLSVTDRNGETATSIDRVKVLVATPSVSKSNQSQLGSAAGVLFSGTMVVAALAVLAALVVVALVRRHRKGMKRRKSMGPARSRSKEDGDFEEPPR